MLLRKLSYKLLLSFALIVIASGCSVEKNTGTTRFYNGLTARFNIYFNGHEAFKAGIAKINKNYKDDFSELLKVFENSDPSTVPMCGGDMERAIQKASKLISLKSITAKPDFEKNKELTPDEKALLSQKEYNEWVDDSYFLIGMARFYKHEFSESESVFNYCIAEANDPEIKLLSSVWLARIKCETGSYIEADRLLREAAITSTSSRSAKSLYYGTMADMYIRQQKYSDAIEPLTNALKSMSGKRAKYRFTYLLAQLYERKGDGATATTLYRQVVGMNPPYDVEFNARINIAGVFDANSGNPQELIKELERMLKDVKNKDFMDQIYYAMGNIMLKEGNIKEAVSYYRKSASSTSVNQNQKGKSYLALAEYFYSVPDYMRAGTYYDSTVYFLDQKYPRYNDLKTKSQNLNALVEQLTVIQAEDSLQRVAGMKKEDRDAVIAGIINKIIKAESEGKRSDYADRANIGQYYENERRSQDNISQEGKWYFYNQAALTFGRTEFRRRWGERRLEDNWRRSNKARVNTQQAAGGQDETAGAAKDSLSPAMDYKKAEFYLKNLPLNDSLLAISNNRMANAYFNAGNVFADKIIDRKKAAGSYEALLARFPGHELVPQTLYDLYKVYKDDNNPKSEITRQRLLEKYPGSEYARILTDPDYYSKRIASMTEAENLYKEAYRVYSLEDYNSAISLSDSGLKTFPNDELAPKFMLLKVYSLAKTGDERTVKAGLDSIITRYAGSEESKKAAELAGWLTKKVPELKIEEDKEIAAEIYVADTTARNSFILIIMDPAFNVNQASFDVISHNIDNFTDRNYRTEGTLVDNKFVMITVSGFKDNRQAYEYLNSFDPGKLIRNSSGARLLAFLMNGENMKAFLRDKDPDRYLLFFKEKYPAGRKNE
ncbi:MAG: tetratricopeptide repeat protein [Bacteroidales bacterium]